MKENKIVELVDCNVVDISIKDLVPNVIDDVIINIIDGNHTIFLPADMTSLQFSNFTNSKGGVFSKDVLRYSKGKPHGKYALVEQPGSKLVIRLIEEEEWLKFQVAGLINGIVKDMPYMLLKEVVGDESLTTTKRKQPLKDDFILPDEEEIIEDEDIHATNIPLFEL